MKDGRKEGRKDASFYLLPADFVSPCSLIVDGSMRLGECVREREERLGRRKGGGT